MNLTTLNTLFSNFSSHKLKSFTKNHLAHANESYIVATSDSQKYVIKILKVQGVESARIESLIQQKVHEARIITPRYLPLKDGEIVGNIKGINFTISDFINGSRDTHVSPGLFFSMGATMARLHQSLEGLIVPSNGAQWLAQGNIQRDLRGYKGNLKAGLSLTLYENLELLSYDLPKSVIHGDLTFNNIFTVADQVTAIFDFETAENAPRVLDIARTFLSLRREVKYPAEIILMNLINGYNSTALFQLTKSELSHLESAINYAAIACAIWCANHNQEDATRIYMHLAKETEEVVRFTLSCIR